MSKTDAAFGVLIRVAARLARGEYMQGLDRACEDHERMRTTNILRHMEDIDEAMKQDAVALRNAADTIRRALGSEERRDKA